MRVHDSQAYRKMDVTRERISRILELREILLSIQIQHFKLDWAQNTNSTQRKEEQRASRKKVLSRLAKSAFLTNKKFQFVGQCLGMYHIL